MAGEKETTVRGTLARIAAHAFAVTGLIMLGICAGHPGLGLASGGGYTKLAADASGSKDAKKK